MFKTVTLRDFMSSRTITDAARELGYTPANIIAALKAGRRIYLTIDGEGRVCDSFEIRRFGKLH